MTPRTLVTGGFGFIASWTAMELVRQGHHVTLVDTCDPAGTPASAAGLDRDPMVTTHRLDITVPGALAGLGGHDGFEYVVHAAALLGVDAVRREPLETLRVNIDGTTNVLATAQEWPSLRRVLLLSTSEVYGNEKGVGEDAWLALRTDDPRWSYAVSKVAAEAYLNAHSAVSELPAVIVRPFNVYGPLRAGSYAVAALGRRALDGSELAVRWPGTQSRSWCHIEDFVDGIVRCLKVPEAIGETFNIGDDRHELTMTDLANLLCQRADSDSPIVHAAGTGPDVQERRPDIGKARRLLGYEPRRALEDGLDETLQWLRAPEDYAANLRAERTPAVIVRGQRETTRTAQR